MKKLAVYFNKEYLGTFTDINEADIFIDKLIKFWNYTPNMGIFHIEWA